MDKATDIGTLLEVVDWIKYHYLMCEEDTHTRRVLNLIVCDITYTVDQIMEDMHNEKIGLDD
jgi:hypothetical protein